MTGGLLVTVDAEHTWSLDGDVLTLADDDGENADHRVYKAVQAALLGEAVPSGFQRGENSSCCHVATGQSATAQHARGGLSLQYSKHTTHVNYSLGSRFQRASVWTWTRRHAWTSGHASMLLHRCLYGAYTIIIV